MKTLNLVLVTLLMGSASLAYADKATDDPTCGAIAKACEAKGYMPGMHKKDHKGLWVDCIHQIAKGKTIDGVTNTADEAKACLASHKGAKKH